MNIKEAAEQIEDAIKAYLAKDDHGLYLIPFRMQRPIIMLGPPGVGKTAIVKQIADRAGINYVSYSITHHTRQSALGLPLIAKEEFDGREYNISEYTMSEIIAAVHRARKSSGVAEGILFLDEINCVSETLAPSMLQFLQYKTFGTHQLPEGWIIVTAGNPPEYNRAAREFDPAMLDRLMRIDIEPDLTAWQEYALSHGVHPAITTYLDSKPSDFYNVRANARGSRIVTSRGWEDLSRMLQAYEHLNMDPSDNLYGRYLQDPTIARNFSVYYGIYRKYQDSYNVKEIINGDGGEKRISRAAKAPFDERIALVGMLLDATCARIHKAIELSEALACAESDLKYLRGSLDRSDNPALKLNEYLENKAQAPVASKKKRYGDHAVVQNERLNMLKAARDAMEQDAGGKKKPSALFRTTLTTIKLELEHKTTQAQDAINNSFKFLDTAFGDESQEAQIYITKLSSDPLAVQFVFGFGSEEYLKHNESLLFNERGLNLLAEIEALED